MRLRDVVSKLIIDATPIGVNAETEANISAFDMFQGVKDSFRLRKRGTVMPCALCVNLHLHNVRRYRAWSALRDHIVDYHGVEASMLPE